MSQTKNRIIALIATVVMSAPVYAHKSITLPPKGSKSLTNHSIFTVNATCSVQSNHANNRIRISVLKNQGTVNGRHLASGQATSVNLNGNASISVSADPGTEVHLVNMGNDAVQADCDV